ncbi:LysR family transcriptional regulator [Mariprofundus ferrooxydans]|uniref:LysR family transcriptional regulator n=1 Tax=Mariprofundus ferrooxydans TaxID=314344 RepID=UPI0003624A16|nr:LysR family transcriptional regulator [Mariprofundus ferrooxydans]
MIKATLQQLRLFEAVARLGSFTRAAEAIHLTQPAISIQVKRLEETLGAPLFEQMGKKIYLTAAGKELYATCRRVFDSLGTFEGKLDELRGEVAGPLNLAAVTTAKYFLPHYLGAFLRRYPKVLPQLKVSNRARITERMEANEDDIYILATLPERIDIEVHPFLKDELVVFAHPKHPLANKKNIPPELLLGERIISREAGSGIRMTFERLLAERGVTLEPYMELGSGEAIKQAVMSGIGIATLSTFSLKLELETGRLVVLDVEGMPIRRNWYAVHRRGKHLTPSALKFIEFLQTADISVLSEHL